VPKRHSLSFTLFLFISDLIMTVFALRLAVLARTLLPWGRFSRSYDIPLAVNFIAVALFMIVYITYGIYDSRHTRTIILELQSLTTSTLLAWFGLAGILYLSFRDVSRLLMIYFLCILLFLVAVHRIAIRWAFKLIGGRSFDSQRVVVVGEGELAEQAGRAIKRNAWAGFYLTGVFPAGDSGSDRVSANRKLIKLIRAENISDVIITEDTSNPETIELIKNLHEMTINIHIIPDLRDLIFINAGTTSLDTLPLITLKSPTLDPFQRLTKRVFDLTLGSIMIVLLAPVMLLIAFAIFIDEPGSPILFIQERVGEKRALLKMIKFRTMKPHAVEKYAQTYKARPLSQIAHKHEVTQDVTRIGRVLRRTALDELPQLFNVIKGEMSLVGPRPEMPWIVDKYEKWQLKRFEIPPGMTGWWQVTRTHDSLMHLSTDADLYYIQHYSLWLDIRILLMTIPAVLRGRGLY
jgi:exopolysaccharide biosynthesis polyprenyl glycosylphosphotransferase